MPAVDASAGLGYAQMSRVCRDVCNVHRDAGQAVSTGQRGTGRVCAQGTCAMQAMMRAQGVQGCASCRCLSGAMRCARGVRAGDTRGVWGPDHVAVLAGTQCQCVLVEMGSPLPLNMGLTLQTPRQPWLANCPKESSMKKRGMPQNTSMMK